MANSVGASGVTGAWASQYVNAGTQGPESPNWGTPVLDTGVPGNAVNQPAELGATIPADVGGDFTGDYGFMFGASAPLSNYEAQGNHITGVGAGLENPPLDESVHDRTWMAAVHQGDGRDRSPHSARPQNMQPYLEHEFLDETDNLATYTPAGQNNDFHGPDARTARDDFRFTTYSGSEWLDIQQQYGERPVYPNVAAQGVVPTADTGLYIPDNSTSVYGGYETVLPDPYQESPDPAVNTSPTPAGVPLDLGF